MNMQQHWSGSPPPRLPRVEFRGYFALTDGQHPQPPTYISRPCDCCHLIQLKCDRELNTRLAELRESFNEQWTRREAEFRAQWETREAEFKVHSDMSQGSRLQSHLQSTVSPTSYSPPLTTPFPFLSSISQADRLFARFHSQPRWGERHPDEHRTSGPDPQREPKRRRRPKEPSASNSSPFNAYKKTTEQKTGGCGTF